ncbi:hypothetical protein ACLUWO_02680 [Pseudoscardovia radai]|uniref:hypothetical protein n=1 Tax=Pseudoscardovia radai TaxID=987066 RepID=UPI003994CB8C
MKEERTASRLRRWGAIGFLSIALASGGLSVPMANAADATDTASIRIPAQTSSVWVDLESDNPDLDAVSGDVSGNRLDFKQSVNGRTAILNVPSSAKDADAMMTISSDKDIAVDLAITYVGDDDVVLAEQRGKFTASGLSVEPANVSAGDGEIVVSSNGPGDVVSAPKDLGDSLADTGSMLLGIVFFALACAIAFTVAIVGRRHIVAVRASDSFVDSRSAGTPADEGEE